MDPAALVYRVASAHLFYRNHSYVSLFGIGIPRPLYVAGTSELEKYLVRKSLNAALFSVGQDYSTNASYSAAEATSFILHEPEIFLVPDRPLTEFVENITQELRKKITAIFRLTAGFEMPEDIIISVLASAQLEKEHRKRTGTWHNDIQGFAVNRKRMNDFSSIFARQNPLDILMLTLGHEIGHCLTPPKKDIRLEEAKAFAFELAWMKTIIKFDILGLGKCMNPEMLSPPKNGIHNEALNIVRQNLTQLEPIEIFRRIAADDSC